MVRLLQVTDTHCYADDDAVLPWADYPIHTNQKLQKVLDHLRPEFEESSALLLTGDLAQEEASETYQRINEMLQGLPLPVYALPGNHDVPGLMKANLKAAEMPFSKIFGKWHVFLLNTHKDGSTSGVLRAEELHSLEEGLRRVPEDHFAIIFMHHHPVKIDSLWMDSIALKNPGDFWQLLSEFSQVKAIFHGHAHQEFEGSYRYGDGREVKVYGTPSTSLQFKPRSMRKSIDHDRPGWREINLGEDGAVETKVYYLIEA